MFVENWLIWGEKKTFGVRSLVSKETVFLYYHNAKVGMSINISQYLQSYEKVTDTDTPNY